MASLPLMFTCIWMVLPISSVTSTVQGMPRSAVGGQGDMVGTDTKGDVLGRHVLGLQSGLLALGQIHADTVDVHMVALVILHQAGVEEVHLRRTDETGYEQVGG